MWKQLLKSKNQRIQQETRYKQTWNKMGIQRSDLRHGRWQDGVRACDRKMSDENLTCRKKRMCSDQNTAQLCLGTEAPALPADFIALNKSCQNPAALYDTKAFRLGQSSWRVHAMIEPTEESLLQTRT
jgi:hypothetical protein